MIKEYKTHIQLSQHFNSKEFTCTCCSKALIDDKIIVLLEKLFKKLDAHKIIITSGYRCNKYELSLKGGVKNGYHTKGMAVDINVWKNDKERYTSKEICLALEDLGWSGGIGIITETAVHIDTRASKYWFDERNYCRSIGTSFYKFFKVDKNENLNKAIDKLASKYEINAEWWKIHYEDDYGKKAIKDLIIKIADKTE